MALPVLLATPSPDGERAPARPPVPSMRVISTTTLFCARGVPSEHSCFILGDYLLDRADCPRDPLMQINRAAAPLPHQIERMRSEDNNARAGDNLLHPPLRLCQKLRVARSEPLV